MAFMSTNPLDPTQGKSGAEIEYMALREEMLSRIEARQQVLSITLTIGGAFLGLGWGAGSIVLMIYPLIALLLAAGWAQNEIKMRQLSNYIRDHLESQIPGAGFESYSRRKEGMGWSLDWLSVGGIFLITQILATGLGVYQFTNGFAISLNWILLLLDLAAIGGLLWLFNYVRERSK
jgi:hypothetical protein